MNKDNKKKEMAKKMPYNSLKDMMAFEEGNISQPKLKKLFQHLVDTGQAWRLQGVYGRQANDMLEQGLIKKPKHGGKGQKDAYGNSLENYYN